MRFFQVKITSEKGAYSVKNVISFCATTIQRPQSLAQVEEFGLRLKLTNELYKIDAVRRDIYKVCYQNLATGSSEIDLKIAYDLIDNMDYLTACEFVKLTEDEIRFWDNALSKFQNDIKTVNYSQPDFLTNAELLIATLQQVGPSSFFCSIFFFILATCATLFTQHVSSYELYFFGVNRKVVGRKWPQSKRRLLKCRVLALRLFRAVRHLQSP